MKKIQVNGVTLAYEELGIGDNVVIASQNRFSPNYWARLLAQPPYHYHVYLLVMRGYGESTHIYSQEPQDFTKPDGIIVEDGLAFQGNPNSGLSATDDSGGTGDDSSLPPPSAGAIAPPVDTSQSGEDLMKESF